jgi:hypothetical protein
MELASFSALIDKRSAMNGFEWGSLFSLGAQSPNDATN